MLRASSFLSSERAHLICCFFTMVLSLVQFWYKPLGHDAYERLLYIRIKKKFPREAFREIYKIRTSFRCGKHEFNYIPLAASCLTKGVSCMLGAMIVSIGLRCSEDLYSQYVKKGEFSWAVVIGYPWPAVKTSVVLAPDRCAWQACHKDPRICDFRGFTTSPTLSRTTAPKE